MQSPIEKLKQNLLMAGLFENALFSLHSNGDDGEKEPPMTPLRIEWLRKSIEVQAQIMQCLITIEKSSEFREFITRLETRTPQLTLTASEKSPMLSNSLFSVPDSLREQSMDVQEQAEALIKAWFLCADDTHPYLFMDEENISTQDCSTPRPIL